MLFMYVHELVQKNETPNFSFVPRQIAGTARTVCNKQRNTAFLDYLDVRKLFVFIDEVGNPKDESETNCEQNELLDLYIDLRFLFRNVRENSSWNIS